MFRMGTKWMGTALLFGGVCAAAWGQSPAQQAQGNAAPAPGSGAALPPAVRYNDGPPAAPAGDCGSGCNNGGCSNAWFNSGGCNDGCCCGQGGFIFGAELHVLRPTIGHNTGLSVETYTNTFGTISTTTDNTRNDPFSYQYTEAPSIWVGYVSDCGLGGRITWFRFLESARTLHETSAPYVYTGTGYSSVTVSSPGLSSENFSEPTTFTATNKLFIESWDFDVTQSFRICKLNLTVGAGIRWFHIDQGYGAGASGDEFYDDEDPTLSVRENDSNSFHGAGPTLLVEGYRQIGCSGASLYATGRAGLLYGNHEQSSVVTSIDPTSFTATTTSSDTDELIGFLEIEAGVQWSGNYGGVHPFARLGLEGRGYFSPGNAVSSASENVGLYGIALSLGASY